MIDEILQQASEIIKNLNWKDFKTVGITDFYFDYYYAESGVYLIHDRIDESIIFVKASSPAEARERAFELKHNYDN